MLTSPWGDQTQLSSGSGLPVSASTRLTYAPVSVSTRHSTREKFTRHWSPARGGTGTRVYSASGPQGNAISTVQPRSSSSGRFSVPSIATAVRRPGMFQS